MTPRPYSIALTDDPPSEARDVILSGLIEFNRQMLGDGQSTPLALLIRDESGAIVGGLLGRTSKWQWLFVELLFIPEALRGRGLARQLLAQAEEEARRRGCIGAWLETFNRDARAVYERCGFSLFGEIPDYPPGNTRAFLSKRWDR
jgi:GNAT superfamily N-acetyltransferase